MALNTGCNGWQEGLDVVVEGEAERVTDKARLDDLARAWAEKWDGSWKFEPVAEGFRHSEGEGIAYVFAVRPAKVLLLGRAASATLVIGFHPWRALSGARPNAGTSVKRVGNPAFARQRR